MRSTGNSPDRKMNQHGNQSPMSGMSPDGRGLSPNRQQLEQLNRQNDQMSQHLSQASLNRNLGMSPDGRSPDGRSPAGRNSNFPPPLSPNSSPQSTSRPGYSQNMSQNMSPNNLAANQNRQISMGTNQTSNYNSNMNQSNQYFGQSPGGGYGTSPGGGINGTSPGGVGLQSGLPSVTNYGLSPGGGESRLGQTMTSGGGQGGNGENRAGTPMHGQGNHNSGFQPNSGLNQAQAAPGSGFQSFESNNIGYGPTSGSLGSQQHVGHGGKNSYLGTGGGGIGGAHGATPLPYGVPEDDVIDLRKPTHKFLGHFPMQVGGYFTLFMLALRSSLFIASAATDGEEMIPLTKTMNVVCWMLGVGDFIATILGIYGLYKGDVQSFKFHFGYRQTVFFVFTPYISGFLLFDQKSIDNLHLVWTIVILLVGIGVEAFCLREAYKTLIGMMEDTVDVGHGMIDLLPARLRPYAAYLQSDLQKKQDASNLVFWKTTPLKYAVIAYAVITLIQCFLGMLVTIFFPQIGVAFGFYSAALKETKSIMFLVDFMGLYFCVTSIAAINQNHADSLKPYLYYLIMRFCALLPVIITNNIMGNLCGSNHAVGTALGYEGSGNIHVSCSAREWLYGIFVLGCFFLHGYFIYLTYLLMVHFDSEREAVLQAVREKYEKQLEVMKAEGKLSQAAIAELEAGRRGSAESAGGWPFANYGSQGGVIVTAAADTITAGLISPGKDNQEKYAYLGTETF